MLCPGKYISKGSLFTKVLRKLPPAATFLTNGVLVFPPVIHLPRLFSLPFLDIAVVLFSVSVTRRHFKQYI